MLAATAVQQVQRVANSMTMSESEITSAEDATNGSMIVLHTRFGRIEVDPDYAVSMPRGLIGFPGQTRFALSGLPDERLGELKALHSLDDESLSILVMPHGLDTDLVDAEDMTDALETLGMSPESTTMLLVVATHRTTDGTYMSVNLRAPIFIDAQRRIASQYVLRNSKYPIRQPIAKA